MVCSPPHDRNENFYHRTKTLVDTLISQFRKGFYYDMFHNDLRRHRSDII
jgi:hypothetical protein